MKRRISALVMAVVLAATWAAPARADWTVNLGYQNPFVSTLGLNLLYIGSEWGFEAGVGWVDIRDQKTTDQNGSQKNDTTFQAAGDVNLKYFLGSGTARPYLQGGVAVGLGASGTGAGVGAGGGFVGLGVLFGTPKFYGYGAYNLDASRDGFVQAGLGIGL